MVFEDVEYVRWPLAQTRSARVYYTAYADNRRIPGAPQLHVAVWISCNGPVPPGHHIHHVDFNPLNNEPDNLVALTPKEHAKAHEGQVDYDSPEWQAHLAAIRPLAAEWHSTPEGLEWHSKHGKATWVDRPAFDVVCEHCRKTYQSPFPERAHFCSQSCREKAGYSERRYQVQVPCPECGTPFWRSKYRPKPATCSKRCGWSLRRRAG